MKGDTVINGITYLKIYCSKNISDNFPSDSLHCFVREDSTKKVYVKYPYNLYNDSTEFILYDFNVNVGDTVMIKLITDGSYHQIVIKYIGAYQFNYDTRTDYEFDIINPPLWGGGCDFGQLWAEGVGSNTHAFYTEIPVSVCNNEQYNVECFWHKGQYVAGGTFCDYFHDGINDLSNEQNQIKTYPNPFSTQTSISFYIPQSSIVSLKVHDMCGREVASLLNEKMLQGNHTVSYSAENLPTGLYYFQLRTENNIETKKMIVIK